MQPSVDRDAAQAAGASPDDGPEARAHDPGLIARLLKEQYVGFCFLDTELRYRYVNDRFCGMIGVSPEEHLGLCVRDVVPEVADRVEPQLRAVLETGRPVIGEMIETATLASDGRKGSYQHNITPFRSASGEIIGLCCVVWDATQRKITEDALAESESRYRSLYDSSPDMFLSVDMANHTIVQCNQTLADTLGYRKEEVIGRPVHWIYAPSGTELIDEALQAVARGEPIEDAQRQLRRRDGTLLYASLNTLPVWLDGEVRYCNSTLRDITEKKQLEMQLIRSQRLESIGQLASGIAHEINTPMQFLGDNIRFIRDSFNEVCRLNEAYVRLLHAAAGGRIDDELVHATQAVAADIDWEFIAEEIPRAIDQSLNGIEHVAHIVRAMKEFSHPGSRERECVDVNGLIETAIAVAGTEWKYVATIEKQLDESIPDVPCYPHELRQVVLNLIVNAAHAIDVKIGDFERKGTIRVSTAAVNGWLEIRVQDTGCGIPADIEDRIFDPFFTTKCIGKGTGQGLAIAHKTIVEKHHGLLSFESEPGEGTTFLVALPLDAEPQASAAPTSRRRRPKRTPRGRS